jgi:Tfp pilus assembly protein PilP
MSNPLFSGVLAVFLLTGLAVAQETAPAKKPVARKPKAKKTPVTADGGQEKEKAADKPVKGKYPPLEARVAAYNEQVEQKKIPREPSRPYLIEPIEITGISEAGEGYNAFVKAEDGTTLILRPGMHLYNGVVEKIEADRIVFRMTATKKTVEKKYGRSIDAQPETP